MDMIGNLVSSIATWAIPVLIAITIHEAAHGFAAYALGDPTARMAGRLSLNPMRHIDPFGTILLPILLLLFGGIIFGYAKPVPVNGRNFRNPRAHMAIVAAAGPFSNLVMAVLGALMLYGAIAMPEFLRNFIGANLINFVWINCLLIALNILPLPPLDGSRVVSGLLPPRLAWEYNKIEPWGIFILVGLIFIVPMGAQIVGLNIDPARALILAPAQAFQDMILSLVGLR